MPADGSVSLSEEDLAALRDAVRKLECPTFAKQAATFIGTPLEKLLDRLPGRSRELVHQGVREAAAALASKGLAERQAPAILRVIAQIAERFGIIVSEKAAAQAVPLIGAVGGAAINSAFIDRYQRAWRTGTSPCGGWSAGGVRSWCAGNTRGTGRRWFVDP